MTKKPASLTSDLLVRKGDATPTPVAEGPDSDAVSDAPSTEGTSPETISEEAVVTPGSVTPGAMDAAASTGDTGPTFDTLDADTPPQRPEPEIVMEPRPEETGSKKALFIGLGALVVLGLVIGGLTSLDLPETDTVAPLAGDIEDQGAPDPFANINPSETVPSGVAPLAETPAPATPVTPPQEVVVSEIEESGAGSLIMQPAATPAPAPTPADPVATPIAKPETPAAPPVAVVETAPVSPPVSPVSEGKIAKSGQYLIQLLSVRSEDAARGAWEKLQAKHANLLGSERLNIEKADLGDRGIYYRVRFGAYDDKGAARATCSSLKDAGQDCLVKRVP